MQKDNKFIKKAINKAGNMAHAVPEIAKHAVQDSKTAIINIIDKNGNGEIDIEDFIIAGLGTPGIKITRDNFLQKEFFKYFPQETIDAAIETSPSKAGIPQEKIDEIADEVIKYERNLVSGISAALGAPGGIATVATTAADLIQYYGYMLRAAQKLMYLYGFPQIDIDEEKGGFDSEIINTLTICLGVMYGVAGANGALKSMATALGKGVEKKLMNKALTKGVIYPVVKKIAHWFNVNMTKKLFANFFKNSIPVAGGLIGAGITFMSFKPCCDKLKLVLSDTYLSNPDYKETETDEAILNDDIIDVDFSVVE